MSCRSETSFSLFFPRSGIEVAPTEVDIRHKRRKFAAGEFRVSREAGELISENVPDYSPVEVRIGGTPSRRMVYTSDGMEFERTTDQTDVADIMLRDPTRVLEQGSLTKRFASVTLDTVIEYILSQAVDEHDVLTGAEFVTGADPLEARTEVGATGPVGRPLEELEFELERADIPYISDIGTFILGIDDLIIEKLPVDTFDGFEFVSVTPLEALNEVMEEFELDYWVGTDGLLQMGVDGSVGRVGAVLNGTDAIKLKRYAITQDPERVSTVYVQGAFMPLTQGMDRGYVGADIQGLQFEAEAVDTNGDGQELAGEITKGLESLEDIEQAAKRKLIREMMDRANGSVEINAIASEDTEGISQLDIGDIIAFEDQLSLACDKELITGPFIINGIEHKSNPRQGWSVSLNVAQLPVLSDIETRSVLYDPETDKEYESLEHYREATSQEGRGAAGLRQ